MTGGIAARSIRGAVPILRSSYEGDGLRREIRNRFLLRRYTDGLIACSRKALQADVATFSFPRDRAWTVYGAVDTDEFSPDRNVPDLRARFGLSKEHFVVGVVARIQARRRFDLLLEAVALASRELDTLRVMIVGRGTHMREVAVEPSKRLHLENCVVFPGYISGDEYIAALKCLDVKVYLFPGTDGTCRALLQAMAMGRPVLVTKRGVLPEIVDDEVEGFVIDDEPRQLADAIIRLGLNPDLRRRLGRNARKRAVTEFSLLKQASVIHGIYCDLIDTDRPTGA
jgi:glycosyltransferase involved in cell wall biosynthesis